MDFHGLISNLFNGIGDVAKGVYHQTNLYREQQASKNQLQQQQFENDRQTAADQLAAQREAREQAYQNRQLDLGY